MCALVGKLSTMDKSTLDFSNILKTINKKFEIINCSWSEEKAFEIKFRTEMDRNSDDYNILCDSWVDIFSDVTNTVWAKKTSNTGPKVKFRKQYQCWTHGGKVIQKELLFDARKCKGTLDIKVLSDVNPSSRRKNKFVRLGLNVVVKINFVHLHKVNVTGSYAFFVHNCKPQTETLKPVVLINEKLPKLVAEMVQKGLTSTAIQDQSKMNSLNQKSIIQTDSLSNTQKLQELKRTKNQQSEISSIELCPTITETNLEKHDLIQEAMQMDSVPTFQLIQNIPIQNINNVKLEFQPGLEQFAQILVSDSNINEPLICQPLLFDNLQSLPHFVQLSSRSLCNQNQSQFLQ